MADGAAASPEGDPMVVPSSILSDILKLVGTDALLDSLLTEATTSGHRQQQPDEKRVSLRLSTKGMQALMSTSPIYIVCLRTSSNDLLKCTLRTPPPHPRQWQVFVSFRVKEARSQALYIKHTLEAFGMSVFVSEVDIPPSADW